VTHEATLLRLLERLLAAPGSGEGWAAFLADLTEALNGSVGNLIAHERASHQGAISVTARTDPEAVRSYNEQWGQYDPWARHPAAQHFRSGQVVLGQSLISEADVKRTAFYNEFARPTGFIGAITGVVEASPGALSVVSINSSEQRRPFGSDEADLLRALMPHLQRAVLLHRRLADVELRSGGLASALDRLPHGVFLLTAGARVMFVNRAAEAMLATKDGLDVQRGELIGATPADTRDLHVALASALALARGDGAAGRTTCRLRRPSDRAPYLVIAAPAPPDAARIELAHPAAILFVTDPERQPHLPIERLRSIFALSPAEARVAQALGRGDTLDEAADRCVISRHTARTHLRRIFEKTGTGRQAELMRVVLSIESPTID